MKKIQFFIGKKEIQILHIASGLFVVAGIGLLIYFFSQSNHQGAVVVGQNTLPPEKIEQSCPYNRILDGVCVQTVEEESPKLIAVMIENHLDARPQSGLSHAAVVYEAPVEANFSRFMALFPITESVSKVGPVRSARPYFLDWVSEYGVPLYMHVGGSPDALAKLGKGNYFDFNEFYRGGYFWRSTDRYAPHNVYTSTALWTEGAEKYGANLFATSTESWLFGNITPCTEACIVNIVASFSPPVYEAEWRYSSSTEKYSRYQLKRPHVDQDGTHITADTVVVQHVTTTVLDDVGRIEMDTIGKGGAVVFTKGNAIIGTWKKTSLASKTRFYDKQGNEIPFTSGKIWIEVVNQRGGAKYK